MSLSVDMLIQKRKISRGPTPRRRTTSNYRLLEELASPPIGCLVQSGQPRNSLHTKNKNKLYLYVFVHTHAYIPAIIKEKEVTILRVGEMGGTQE